MRQVKPAGLQAPRNCHGKFKKLMRKVEITFTLPIYNPKNQSSSFDYKKHGQLALELAHTCWGRLHGAGAACGLVGIKKLPWKV